MNEISIVQQRMLHDLQRLTSSIPSIVTTNTLDNTGTSFSNVLAQAISKVNTAQNESKSLQDKFELGDGGVSLQDVVFATHKAGMSFQVMSQMRNKWISAYQEIMNTQI